MEDSGGMVAMSAANMGRNWTGEGKERVAGCREKWGGVSKTAVDGGKEADVGIVKSIYWLHHYRIRDKHKAHVS